MRSIALLGVLCLTIACAGPAGPSPAATGPQATQWRVLAEGLWRGQEPFSVGAAFSQSQLEALWQELGSQGVAPPPVPEVNFEREAVLFLGMAGSSSCPEVLERIVVDEGAARVYGQWRRHEQRACTDDLASQGVLIAIQRELLPAGPFMLSLREQPICADCPTHPDLVLVDPSSG